jgi:hypothetical protein
VNPIKKVVKPELVEGGFILIFRVRQAHPDRFAKSTTILYKEFVYLTG